MFDIADEIKSIAHFPSPPMSPATLVPTPLVILPSGWPIITPISPSLSQTKGIEKQYITVLLTTEGQTLRSHLVSPMVSRTLICSSSRSRVLVQIFPNHIETSDGINQNYSEEPKHTPYRTLGQAFSNLDAQDKKRDEKVQSKPAVVPGMGFGPVAWRLSGGPRSIFKG